MVEEKERLAQGIKEFGGLWLNSEEIDLKIGEILEIKEKRQALKVQKQPTDVFLK